MNISLSAPIKIRWLDVLALSPRLIFPPVTLIPFCAVMIPTELMVVTSSLLKSPVTTKSPVTFAPPLVVSNFFDPL